ncbi:MAG: SulP family inorganic anion transporter [Myxococcales bacterium]|nr:SulP family inorganic anion transporter [Myxococcales bacterium]MCB9526435.1 SulP family inorganic anion transporter [Myxococcales bacterium]
MALTKPSRKDLVAGLLVFLIALPLCLGISLASGFPPVAGLLTAIVGGLLASHLGSAPLTIKGPAAGLIVIALGAVTELGQGDAMLGYRRALAVGVVAGAIQLVLGVLRAGRIAVLMPLSVVHGMLAAIGVIILAKQLPVVLGVLGAKGAPLAMLVHLPQDIMANNPEIMAIGLISLAILATWRFVPGKLGKIIPAPLVVLFIAVPLSLAFDLSHTHTYTIAGQIHEVGPAYLVNLPGNLLDAVTLPLFDVITSATSLKYIAMFALVGTIESLLSVLAVDAMDPAKRTSNLDADLRVTGLANLVAAAIGGLPMISEIVRSKANIDAGALTSWANFFHGAALLVFVAAAPALLHLIPLAALAAMLVMVGVRLASPGEFRHVWHIGKDQFVLFVVTLAVTLATDLLVGVGVGVALKVVLHLARGASPAGLFKADVQASREGDTLVVRARGALLFTNLLALRRVLAPATEPGIKTVRLVVDDVRMVDHTTQERLHAMANEWPDARLVIEGLGRLHAVSGHRTAFRSAR